MLILIVQPVFLSHSKNDMFVFYQSPKQTNKAADHSKMGGGLSWLQSKLPAGNLTQAQEGFVKQIGRECSFFYFLLLFYFLSLSNFSQAGAGCLSREFSNIVAVFIYKLKIKPQTKD